MVEWHSETVQSNVIRCVLKMHMKKYIYMTGHNCTKQFWQSSLISVTLTVTEALVLRPLLEDQGASQNQSVSWCSFMYISAVSAPSVACFMLTVQQQKRLCRQFVNVSAARRDCQISPRQSPQLRLHLLEGRECTSRDKQIQGVTE